MSAPCSGGVRLKLRPGTSSRELVARLGRSVALRSPAGKPRPAGGALEPQREPDGAGGVETLTRSKRQELPFSTRWLQVPRPGRRGQLQGAPRRHRLLCSAAPQPGRTPLPSCTPRGPPSSGAGLPTRRQQCPGWAPLPPQVPPKFSTSSGPAGSPAPEEGFLGVVSEDPLSRPPAR